jgi:hypothetical protein
MRGFIPLTGDSSDREQSVFPLTLLPSGSTNPVTGILHRHPRSLDPGHGPAELLQEHEVQIAALKWLEIP